MNTTRTTTENQRRSHSPENEGPSAHKIHWGWLAGWATISAATVFEIAKHGFVNGNAALGVSFVAVSVGFFIAPDLTFLIGIGDEVPKGYMSPRAVAFYNALHRIWVPATLTTLLAVALAPLSTPALLLFVGGLSWMAHIALDRAAGYGLRTADGGR